MTNTETTTKAARRLVFKIPVKLVEYIASTHRAELRSRPNKGVVKDSVFSAILWEAVKRGYTLSVDSDIVDDDIHNAPDYSVGRQIIVGDNEWYIEEAKKVADANFIASYYTVISHWLKLGLGLA